MGCDASDLDSLKSGEEGTKPDSHSGPGPSRYPSAPLIPGLAFWLETLVKCYVTEIKPITALGAPIGE